MNRINQLETRLSSRYEEEDPAQEGNANPMFSDLIVDGRSLDQILKKYELVPGLGWGSDEDQKRMIDYLLLKQLHPDLYYRYPIFVCPWCRDEECGFISVLIEKEGDFVSWSDFRLEPDNQTIELGSYTFKWSDYEKVINRTYKGRR